MIKSKEDYLSEMMQTFPKPVDEQLPHIIAWVHNRFQIISFHTRLVRDDIDSETKPLTTDELKAMMGVVEDAGREMFHMVQALAEYVQHLKNTLNSDVKEKE